MKKNILTNIRIAITLALVCSVLMGMSRFETQCQELRDNVLRLHIIANSDSDFDQQLKLKVRDAVLEETGELFKASKDLESAISTAQNSVDKIKAVAEKTISAFGKDYKIEVNIGDAYFDTREYEEFTLPAGVYKAVNIKIGKAQGKNWWCVMFPALCIGSAAKLSDATPSGAQIAQNSGRYVMRFKIVEIYEQIKQRFKG